MKNNNNLYIIIIMNSTMENNIKKYIETLNKKELKAYEIAKSHLGMSFQIEKSIGYIEWLKTNKN